MTDYFVHESSYIDEGAEIGAGTKIWHFSHVMTRARIGERCNIGQNVLVSPEVTIGNNVKIQNNVSLYTGVIVEEDAFLGPSMVFTNVINPRSHVNRKNEYQTTLVRKGASIGANATIHVRDNAWTVLFCRGRIGGYPRRAGLCAGLWFAGAGARVDVPVRRTNKVHGTRRSREGGLSKLRGCLSEAGASCRPGRRRMNDPAGGFDGTIPFDQR